MAISAKSSASLILAAAVALVACRSDDGYHDLDEVQVRPAAAGKLSPSAFVDQAASAGKYEVQAATIAEQKELAEPVADLARRIRTDHQNANVELEQLASALGIRIPKELTSKQEQMLGELRALSGSAFAAAYLRQQIEAHQEAVALFELAVDSIQEPRLAAFAQQKLPILRHHLELATSRLQNLGG